MAADNGCFELRIENLELRIMAAESGCFELRIEN